MRFQHVHIAAVAYDLPTEVVTTRALEEALAAAVPNFPLPLGQLEAMTGVIERRFWPREVRLADGAMRAAQKALLMAGVDAAELGAVIYAGVCRDRFEPATACAVADALGVAGAVAIHDISNACLGVLTAVLDVANRIELGQIDAGLIVTNESAREIIEETLARLGRRAVSEGAPAAASVATFTGGSAACAVLLTRAAGGARLLGATLRAAPAHHRLCTWGLQPLGDGQYQQLLLTDAPAVLRHGLALGAATWRDFLKEMNWTPANLTRVITHQVGRAHQDEILKILEIDRHKDFVSYPFLGNTGSAALPTTLAIAAERGLLKRGDKLAMLGIGSGLSCLMLGVEW